MTAEPATSAAIVGRAVPRVGRRFKHLPAHLVLIAAIAVLAFPIFYTVVAATHTTHDILIPPMSLLPGGHGIANFWDALTGNGLARVGDVGVLRMLWNTTIVALAIAIGKIVISFLSAYAIVFFRFPLRMAAFWMIFASLMLPIEVRIVPTYKVIVDLHMIDTYAGLTVPLMASATATFLFRQFFMTVPGELVEAARIDGAGPLRFMKDILFPLSRTNIAALFVILFIYGWTQYLWPLLVTNDNSMNTIIIGFRKMVSFDDASTPWDLVMATAILSMVPPIAVVVFMQRWFIKGLVDSEK